MIFLFDMVTIKIADKEWGASNLLIDFKKIDILPHFCISQMTGLYLLSIGFLMLTFNLIIFDSNMRRMNKGNAFIR